MEKQHASAGESIGKRNDRHVKACMERKNRDGKGGELPLLLYEEGMRKFRSLKEREAFFLIRGEFGRRYEQI